MKPWSRSAPMNLESRTGRRHAPSALLSAAVTLTCLLAAITTPASAYAQTPIVTFPDAALNAAVHTQMGIPLSTVIHQSDLTTLTALTASSAGIAHLDGLEWAKHLQSLNLSSNNITTITALAGCTALSDINVYDNMISDLTPLASISHLHWLSMESNAATSLAGLENQADLQYLNAQYNQIESIAPLANHPWLQTLSLYSNQITDLAPLRTDPTLQNLSLGHNPSLTDISALSTMTTLADLSLSYSDVSDISPLAGLTNLQSVNFYANNNLTDITALKTLTKLQFVNLEGCQVYDIAPLDNINGTVKSLVRLKDNWLDLTPGSDTSKTVSALIAKGYTVDFDPQRTGGGVILGVVRDARTGKVLGGVKAALTSGPSATSAASGAYKIGLARPGMRTLTFTKPYFSSETTTFDLDPGDTSTVNVSLIPVQLTPKVTCSPSSSSLTYRRKKGVAKFTMSATVTDARGRVAGLSIWLQRSTNGRTWSTVKKLTTSSAGRASLAISTRKKGTTYYRWYSQKTSADKYVKTKAQKVRIK